VDTLRLILEALATLYNLRETLEQREQIITLEIAIEKLRCAGNEEISRDNKECV